MSLDKNLEGNIDGIALGIMQEQERTGKSISPIEVASLAMTLALRESANWLRETLGEGPDFRYTMSLLLDEQADILSRPKE